MSHDINSITLARPLPPTANTPAAARKNKHDFQNVLQKELNKGQDLKFSAHAEKRLKEREIVLTREELVKIDRAVQKAEAKGGRESLIIYGELALIASIKNKTVVTALDKSSMDGHVFTNIDSAVIIG